MAGAPPQGAGGRAARGRGIGALKNVEGAWIKEQKVIVTDGKINGFRVNMLVTFVLGGDTSI